MYASETYLRVLTTTTNRVSISMSAFRRASGDIACRYKIYIWIFSVDAAC